MRLFAGEIFSKNSLAANGSRVNFQAIFRKQARQPGKLKTGFFHSVGFRVDGEVECLGKIGTLEVGFIKYRLFEVAMRKNGIAKVGSAEIGMMENAVFEFPAVHLPSTKG